MAHRKLFDFMMQTSSGTLGTIIGILLTLGTTYYQQQNEKRKTERITTLMVIHNLDDFSEKLEDFVKHIDAQDSIIWYVWQHSENLDKVSEDTLGLFLGNLINFSDLIVDNSAESIFSTNIDTWKSIENHEFVEHVGKCFFYKNSTMKTIDDLWYDRHKIYYEMEVNLNYCNKPCRSRREAVERMFHIPKILFLINKLHTIYTPFLKMNLNTIKEENAKNKKLMKVTDEEMKRFRDLDNPVPTNEKSKSKKVKNKS